MLIKWSPLQTYYSLVFVQLLHVYTSIFLSCDFQILSLAIWSVISPQGCTFSFFSHPPIWTGESCTIHSQTVNHLIGNKGFITTNIKQKSKSTTTELEWNKVPSSYCQITVLSLNEWSIKLWSFTCTRHIGYCTTISGAIVVFCRVIKLSINELIETNDW